MRAIPGVILHWPAYTQGQINARAGKILVDEIRSFHTRPVSQGGRGWSDIGYHYVINKDKDGIYRVYDGCPDSSWGAHTYGFNDWLGISVAYGTDSGELPDELINTVASFISTLSKTYGFKINSSTVKGHRDMSGHESNECPGNLLHREIKNIISLANNTKPRNMAPQNGPEKLRKEEEIGSITLDIVDTGKSVNGIRINSQAYIHVSELKNLGFDVTYTPPSNGKHDKVTIKKRV